MSGRDGYRFGMPHAGISKLAASAAALAILSPAALAEVSWSVDTGVARSDNARLTSTGEISDQVATLGGQFTIQRESRRLQASLTGSGNYVNYLDGTFDDDLVAHASANLVFGIVPDRIMWTLEDTFGQIAIDELEAITPGNRQNVNNVVTGPDFVLQISDHFALRAEARYGGTRYEDSRQSDTQQWSGTLRLERSVSRVSTLALAVSQYRVMYDVDSIPDIDYQSAYATWSTTGARQTVTLDVGANRVDLQSDTKTEPMGRLSWTRRITPSLSMNVNLRSEYQSFTQRFTQEAGGDSSDVDYLRIVEAPARVRAAGTSFTFERPRTHLSVFGGYSKLDYTGLNGAGENYWYVGGEFNRRLTPRLQAFLSYRYYQNEYDSIAALGFEASDRNRNSGAAGIDWLFGRSTALTLGYSHDESNGDSVDIRRYARNVVYIQLSYRHGEGLGPRLINY